ncbi:MAG: helix-turn-helix domain-containing protein [Phycisphaerales bacterium]
MTFALAPIGYVIGGEPVLADTNTAILLNLDQPYSRLRVDPRGAETEWIELSPEVMAELVSHALPGRGVDVRRPFPVMHGPVPSHAFLARRMLTLAIESGGADPNAIEKAAIGIVRATLASVLAPRPAQVVTMACLERRRDVVEYVREMLARRFRQRVRLDELATEVGLSSYHVSRMFHDLTGSTMRRYLDRLRLRWALEHICRDGRPLAGIAREAGYCSESHLSDAFAREFGVRPARVRRPEVEARMALIRELLSDEMRAAPPADEAA